MSKHTPCHIYPLFSFLGDVPSSQQKMFLRSSFFSSLNTIATFHFFNFASPQNVGREKYVDFVFLLKKSGQQAG